MIPVQLETMFSVVSRLGPTEPRDHRALLRRLQLLLGFPVLEGLNAAGLVIDELTQPLPPVRAPVFVIGPPRTGTTHLHRLLLRDPAFTSFRMWQLLLPSATAQRAVRRLARLDERLGAPLRRRLAAAQDAKLADIDRIHRLRLDESEEDEYLMMHTFGSELLAVNFPRSEVLEDYRRFDTMPEARRRSLMAFYERCLRRHMAVEGQHRRFLSKNTVFCNKVNSLRETFPDARFIFTLRDPRESVPSMISLIKAMRQVGDMCEPGDDEDIVRFMVDCYDNVDLALRTLPPSTFTLVRYEELTSSPRTVVERSYAMLEMPITPELRAVLDAEEEAAKRYRSRHAYALGNSTVTPRRFNELAGHVCDRLGFGRMEG